MSTHKDRQGSSCYNHTSTHTLLLSITWNVFASTNVLYLRVRGLVDDGPKRIRKVPHEAHRDSLDSLAALGATFARRPQNLTYGLP